VTEQPPAFDPVHALAVLNAHKVRYVVIGGVAAAALGSPALTTDLDICYARDSANLRALAGALMELGARLRGAPAGVPFQLDDATLRNGDHFTFTTDAGDLDVLGTPAGSNGYADLIGDSFSVELVEGLHVHVTSLAQLIRMKEAAGRPKDRYALEILAALRDEIEGD
jgi:hypothetical protein